MESKEARTATHKAVREALNGLFETTSRDIPGEVGQRIVIKWSNKQSRRDDRQGASFLHHQYAYGPTPTSD